MSVAIGGTAGAWRPLQNYDSLNQATRRETLSSTGGGVGVQKQPGHSVWPRRTAVSCSWRTARERTRKTQKSVSKAIGPLTPVTRGGTVLAGSKSGTLPSVHVTVPPRYPPDTTCPIQWRYGTAQSVVGRWATMPAGGLQPWAPPHGGHAAADTHVCDLRRSTVVPPRRGLTSQPICTYP